MFIIPFRHERLLLEKQACVFYSQTIDERVRTASFVLRYYHVLFLDHQRLISRVFIFADPAVGEPHYESDLVGNRVTENKTFDDDFLLCKEEMQDKRQYQELMSGVPEESPGVVHNDLEISDSDDETKERNIDIPEKVVQSNVPENEDDDPDGLWF